jgi:hypothetical protein
MMACKFCNRGARPFCERHGFDWWTFVTQGVEVSELEHIDDAMLKQVIERARMREQEGLKNG